MSKAQALKEEIATPCLTETELHQWISAHMQLSLPTQAVCAEHCAPFEYIRRSYFEPATDLVVWAPRGGGKTRLAAMATLLDLLHKPGVSVRILGGSLEQSMRMWEHLLPDVEEIAGDSIVGAARSRRIKLYNNSNVAVSTQSQRAVRGLRVQKIRCDEIELFDEDVWAAVQLVTRSTPDAKQKLIVGAIDALSTLHNTHGLMQSIVEQAKARNTPVLRWCIMEVLERCPAERDCATCPLWEECRGLAKTRCDGFMRIDDAIAMKRRVSLEMWETEMLCKRPSREDAVFPRFDSAIHVTESPPAGMDGSEGAVSLAIDFGFKNPFVCLWIRALSDGRAHVVDEYVQPKRTMGEHIDHIRLRRHGHVGRACCDPAGAGRNDQTAQSNVELLKQAGYRVFKCASSIVDGVERVRAALHPACGSPRLYVHPRCTRLIKAFQNYHYARGGSELPLKDGEHDHLIDALRYYFVNTTSHRVEGGGRY